jgi:hypothetical protein
VQALPLGTLIVMQPLQRSAWNANAAVCSSLVGESSRGAGLQSVMSRGCDRRVTSHPGGRS